METKSLRRVVFALSILATTSAFAEMRVAVLEFTNASPNKDDDALGKGLQSMFTTDLSNVTSLQLVERSKLAAIQSELKLQKDSSIDPKTAVRLGKLAGATHLLTGSFTVVGKKMRLDARVFAVQDGTVLLAAKEEGETEAFFDLQKEVTKKLIGAVGVKLAPKERAEVQKMHTLDYDAFSKFSKGIALFDEKKYSEALAALKDANARDKDFKLAAMTLSEYERVIGELRTEATNLEAKQKEMAAIAKALERDKSANAEAQSIAKMFEWARRKDPGSRKARLAAMFVLAMEHDSGLTKFSRVTDLFTLQRTGDALTAGYLAEVLPKYPADPYPLHVTSGYSHRLPDIEKWQKDFDYLVEEFGKDQHKLVENLRIYPLAGLEQGRRLHYDRKQTVAHLQQLNLALKKIKPDLKDGWQQTVMVAREYRRILELDKSTQLFAAIASEQKDPDTLRAIANELEINKQLTQLLASHKRPVDKYFREYILLKYPQNDPHQWEYLRNEWEGNTPGGTLSPKTLYLLAELRAFPDYHFENANKRSYFGYLLMGEHPVWAFHSRTYPNPSESYRTGMGDKPETLSIVTGPRTDELRADEVRYYGLEDPKRQVEPLLLIDGVAKKDVTVRFVVSFTPAADWWPRSVYHSQKTSIADANIDPSRPEVGFFYNLRNPDAQQMPLSADGVLIGADGVRQVSFTEERGKHWKITPKSEQKGDTKGKELKVVAKVSGDSVKLTIDGKTYSWKVPADREGYYGLWLRGRGYAAIRQLAVE